MTVPRVLLLTHTLPGALSAAGHILRDICLLYPSDSICCFCVTRPEWFSKCDPDWLPIAYARSPREHRIFIYGPHFMHISAFMFWNYQKLIYAPHLVRSAVQFGRRQGVEVVLAILNSPVQIEIAARVASKLGARLVTIVWDPPEFLSLGMGLDRFSHRNLLREFEKVLHTTVRCGVASEGMAAEYRQRYGVDPVVLIHGVHPNLIRQPAKEITSNEHFTIGFIGSLYAIDAWQALLAALSKVNWQIEGRKVIIRVLSTNMTFRSGRAMHIEYLGWHSLEETVGLMSQVDATYLPYWFDKSYSLSVRLCFPNKLATFLAAGRPVFFHGPEDSSPARFFRRFPAGLCCHSLEETEIINSLRRFITDTKFYAGAAQACQAACEQQLNRHIFRQRFAALMGISEDELLPLN